MNLFEFGNYVYYEFIYKFVLPDDVLRYAGIGKARKTTLHMDTNDLSRETHAAIIDTAERFHHDLTLQFGVLAGDCDTDNEFLDESESMIKEWMTDWDMEEAITEIFFDSPPNKKNFKKILDKILTNIENVRKIPMEQRKFDLW